MTTKALPGNYIGKIIEHGSDERNGLALIRIDVQLVGQLGEDGERHPFNGEVVFCRVYLEGKSDEKSETATRMARQTLRLCGFDPDQRPLSDLDDAPRLLFGVEVPIRVSENESNGKFYTNYDIATPRGITKDKSSRLTDRLRAAKAKDETAVAAKPATTASAPQPTFSAADAERARKATAGKDDVNFDDIPF